MARGSLTHKQWTQRFVFFSLLPLVLVGVTIFVVDPLQHYRRATFYRPLWLNARFYNAGFVAHYDYDCIIIGTSMVENFIPSAVGKKLSTRALLAPMRAATPCEEYVLLSAALRTGKVRTVIWGLDITDFGYGEGSIRTEPGNMPVYLYDNNPFNDYQYLANIDVLLNDCRLVLAANLQGWRDRALSIDSAHFWGDEYGFSRDAALNDWRRRQREVPPAPCPAMTGEAEQDSMERSFDANVLSLVERHPQVRYLFFYPPISILAWTMYDSVGLRSRLAFKRYVFERFRALPNVTLFDFQDVSDITCNFDKYMDYKHYSPDVNEFIVNAMAANDFTVTDDNVDEKISRLESQVRAFVDSLDADEHRR
jgi:hypothetical protein